MDYILTGATGALVKLYDDCIDNKQITDELIKESMFTLICLFFGAIARGDFFTALIVYLVNFINYLADPSAWDNPKEKSILIVFPILLLLTYSGFPDIHLYDYILLGLLVVGAFVEAKVIQEEYSIRKLIIRAGSVALFSAILYTGYHTSLISASFMNIVSLFMGYTTVSVVVQTLQIMKHTDTQEKLIESTDV